MRLNKKSKIIYQLFSKIKANQFLGILCMRERLCPRKTDPQSNKIGPPEIEKPLDQSMHNFNKIEKLSKEF